MLYIAKWSLAVPFLLGCLGTVFTDFGDEVDISYFSTIAQIAPVFLVAMLISELFMLRKFTEEAGDEIARKAGNEAPVAVYALGELMVNSYIALLVGVEIPALIATALRHSTTFLFLWTSGALVALVLAFRRNQVHHFGVSIRRFPPAIDEDGG